MDCKAGVRATKVVTVAPSLGSSSCEIPRSRLEGVTRVEVVSFIVGRFKVNRRLPTWFLEGNPFDFVLSPLVVKPGIEDFFYFPGFLAVDNNWRGL